MGAYGYGAWDTLTLGHFDGVFGTTGAQAEALQNGWYWAGAATATALTAYYTAPIALGHLGRVAQVGFVVTALAGAGCSAYQIGSNWDRMSTTQRVGTVAVIAAGLLGGWAGYARFAPRPLPAAQPLEANPYAGIYKVGPNGGMIGPPLSPNGIGYSSGIAGATGRPLMFSGMVGVSAAEAASYAASGRVVAPNSVSSKFRGEPFAFGSGSRLERALAMAEEAARASNVNLFDVVDEVRYVRGSSYFDVDLAGNRILHIGDNAFGRNQTGQLLEATHELIHAQRYSNVLRGRSGNFVQAYDDYFLAKPFGSDLYALEEVSTELLAMRRVQNYLGGLTPQQRAASTRYINDWMARFLGNN